MSEEIKETAGGELTQGEFTIKKKPRKLANKKQDVAKVDLKEGLKEEVVEEDTKVVLPSDNVEKEKEEVVEENKEIVEENKEEVVTQEKPIEEIVEVKKENVQEQKEVKTAPESKVPENLKDLVKFMNDTGGDLEDYVNLNKDYSKLNDDSILLEYYKKTKPHLEKNEIEFLLEDQFSWDEETEEERQVKKKKLAFKEEIAKAKQYLESSKKDYYKEIKLNSNIGTSEEQKAALDFVNTYKENQQQAEKLHGTFKSETVEFFKGDFNGFNFDVGEKEFRYKINNPSETADRQSNLKSVFKKFLNDDGSVKDYSGYHKAIYAASNADTVAKHFYEQGKADATKDIIAKSKNIQDGKPRTTSGGDVYINGLKVKAITGADGSKLKIKKRT